MSNLGAYQEITTAAKEAGGVEKLIEAIGHEAVWKAAPKLIVASVASTIVVLEVGRRVRDRYLLARERGEMAKEQIRTGVQ